jgi:seryl-tRNA synthetase
MVADATNAAIDEVIKDEREASAAEVAVLEKEINRLNEQIDAFDAQAEAAAQAVQPEAAINAEMADAAETLTQLQEAYQAAIERQGELQSEIANTTEDSIVRRKDPLSGRCQVQRASKAGDHCELSLSEPLAGFKASLVGYGAG